MLSGALAAPSDSRWAGVDRLVADAVSRHVFPGAVLAVGHGRGLLHLRAFGSQTYDRSSPPVGEDTIYDIASMTKVVATTPVVMALVDDSRLDLEAPVSRYVPEFTGDGRETVRVVDLLRHSSGLPAWEALYRQLSGSKAYVARISTTALEAPPSSRALYSDLGMILLGEVAARAGGQPLDELAQKRVFEPLGLLDTGYRPAEAVWSRIAPTEECLWRRRLIRGEVHDENAYAMGGVAGNAGVFSTAPDLARVAEMMLNRGLVGRKRMMKAETIALFTRRSEVSGLAVGLGWQFAVGENSPAPWSTRAFGHTGLTGTMMWIDPGRDLYLILLTNAIHPRRGDDSFGALARLVESAVVQLVKEP